MKAKVGVLFLLAVVLVSGELKPNNAGATTCTGEVVAAGHSQTVAGCGGLIGGLFANFHANVVAFQPHSPIVSSADVTGGGNNLKLIAVSGGPDPSEASGAIDTSINVTIGEPGAFVNPNWDLKAGNFTYDVKNASLVIKGNDHFSYSFIGSFDGESAVDYTVTATAGQQSASYTANCDVFQHSAVPTCNAAVVHAAGANAVDLPFSLSLPVGALFAPGALIGPVMTLDLQFSSTVVARDGPGGCSVFLIIFGFVNCSKATADAADPLEIDAMAILDSSGNPIPLFEFTSTDGFDFSAPTLAAAVPEPSTLMQLAVAVAGFGFVGWGRGPFACRALRASADHGM